MTFEEAFEKTKDYYCYGEDEADLKIRWEMAKLAKGIIADFGTGEGRTAMIMALANPEIAVMTFDHGRKDITDEALMDRTFERANQLGIENLYMTIADATVLEPASEVAILNVDIEDGYEQAKTIAEKWFPSVKGVIFIQTYDMGKYPEMTRAFREYIERHGLVLGEKYGNTRVVFTK